MKWEELSTQVTSIIYNITNLEQQLDCPSYIVFRFLLPYQGFLHFKLVYRLVPLS